WEGTGVGTIVLDLSPEDPSGLAFAGSAEDAHKIGDLMVGTQELHFRAGRHHRDATGEHQVPVAVVVSCLYHLQKLSDLLLDDRDFHLRPAVGILKQAQVAALRLRTGGTSLPRGHVFLLLLLEALDLTPHAAQIQPQLSEDASSETLIFGDQPQQEMLGADVVVIKSSCFLVAEVDRAFGPRRQLHVLSQTAR